MRRSLALPTLTLALPLSLLPLPVTAGVSSPPGMAVAADNAKLPDARDNLGIVTETNPKADYGAKGDNATDDGPALATALATCGPARPLYLPPGIYRTRQKLTAPAYCRIYGDQEYTYKVDLVPNAEIVADNTSGAFTAGGAVLTLGAQSQLVGVAVFGDNVAGHADAVDIAGSWVVIRNSYLRLGGTYSLYCPAGLGYQGIQVRDSLIAGSQGDGMKMQCADSTMIGNDFYANVGVGADAFASKLLFVGNTIEGNQSYGLAIFNNTRATVVGNHIVDNDGPGIELNGNTGTLADVTITGNDFSNNGQSQGSQNDCHVWLAGTVTNLNMAGNSFDSGQSFGSATPTKYVFCGSTGSSPALAGSRIAGSIPAQATGVFEGSVIQAAVQPALWQESVNGTQAGVSRVLCRSAVDSAAGADTTEDVLATCTIPAGAMAKNGQLRVVADFVNSGAGGNRTTRIRWNGIAGTTVAGLTNNATAVHYDATIANQNATGAQRLFAARMDSSGASINTAPTTGAVDTTAATTVVITCAKASATDTCTLADYRVELLSDGT